jgi:hypothetical protein
MRIADQSRQIWKETTVTNGMKVVCNNGLCFVRREKMTAWLGHKKNTIEFRMNESLCQIQCVSVEREREKRRRTWT